MSGPIDSFCFTVLCAPVEEESSCTVTNARISFDSSLFSGVVAGVYARPRTWGRSGSYRFGAL